MYKRQGLQPDLQDLRDALGMEAMEREIAELEQKQAEPGFWDRMEESQKILQRASFLKNRVEDYQKLMATYEDALALIEMGDEAEDLSLLPEACLLYTSSGFVQYLLGNHTRFYHI